MQKAYNLAPESMTGNSGYEFIDQDDRVMCTEKHLMMMQTGLGQMCFYRRVNPYTKEVFVVGCKDIRFANSAKDIHMYEYIVFDSERLNTPMIVCNPNGTVVYVNKHAKNSHQKLLKNIDDHMSDGHIFWRFINSISIFNVGYKCSYTRLNTVYEADVYKYQTFFVVFETCRNNMGISNRLTISA